MTPRGDLDLGLIDAQEREHAAWLDVGNEFKKLGIDINLSTYDPLMCALRKWGEELHQLRDRDPNAEHALTALRERREGYEGQYERGEYPLSF